MKDLKAARSRLIRRSTAGIVGAVAIGASATGVATAVVAHSAATSTAVTATSDDTSGTATATAAAAPRARARPAERAADSSLVNGMPSPDSRPSGSEMAGR